MSLTIVLLLLAFSSSLGNSDGSLQRFLAEPSDAVVVKGQVQMLSCAVENLVGEVQWMRDGFGLGLGTEFEGYPRYKVLRNDILGEHTLMVSNVQLEDDAQFQCQVGATENSTGLRSHMAKLTVLLPPESVSIDEGPIVQVLLGAAHNLTCRASNGKPAPNITWYSGEAGSDPIIVTAGDVMTTVVTLEDGKRQNVTSSLVINPTKNDQGRRYECHAFNDAMLNSITTHVTIEVIYPPEISIILRPNILLREFDAVSIYCNASANPRITEWRWFLGGEQIKSKDSSSSVLELTSIGRDLHKKTVVCEAVNRAGLGQQSTTLDITYGPVFETLSESESADPGDSVKLSCAVDSNPPPSIVWRKKGESRVLSSNSSLSISEVTEEDFGVYTCTASLIGFEEVSQDVRLNKKGPPFIVSPSEQSARYGEVGVIDCVVDAVPRPIAITWFRENSIIGLNSHSRYKVREEDTREGRHSILEINGVQDQDFGTYNCTTDNGYGEAHQVIYFSKRAMMPLPIILVIVLSGVLLIIVIISVAIFVYRRRASLGSEKGSDSSEYNITKQKDGLPDIKVEYVNGATQPQYSTVVDPWNTDMVDGRRLPHYHSTTAQYAAPPDDLWSRPRYMPPVHSNLYSQSMLDNPTADVYGTYPRRPRQNASYDNSVYGSDMYGTLRGGLPPQFVRPYDYMPPPASPSSSRLSTNV